MRNINTDNIEVENYETTLLLNDDYDDKYYKRKKSISTISFSKKILLYIFIILISISIILGIKFTISSKKSVKANDPLSIQIYNLNYINNITMEAASRTHLIEKENDNDGMDNKKEVEEGIQKLPNHKYTELEIKKKLVSDTIFKTKTFDFYYIDKKKGPITTDLNNDDGTKADLYSRLNTTIDPRDFKVYKINEEEFKKIKQRLPSYKSIFCEIPQTAAPESIIGYKLKCPLFYTLRIEKAYFGNHNKNEQLCSLGVYVGPENIFDYDTSKNKSKRNTIGNKEDINNIKESVKEIEKEILKGMRTELIQEEKDTSIIKREEKNVTKSDEINQNNNNSTTNTTITENNVSNSTSGNETAPLMNETNNVAWSCDSYPLQTVKEQCENKTSCSIKPIRSFFGYPCPEEKYLELKYHCEKEEIKQPRIAIVTFSNFIKSNSIYENAINELYQYAKIHNYDLYIDKNNYNTDREIYYMKTNTIIKYLMKFLDEKTYDWIFWVDSDVLIVNPNIKLETFLPPLINDEIHLIISKDDNGLNAGIFFLRVHTWSLSFMMRSSVYTYYNKPRLLFYSDQASMNNVLVENESDKEHYILVPQKWFNMYLNKVEPGYFLIHFAGIVSKEERAKEVRIYLAGNPYYYATTSEDVRKEVEEYYKLPQNKTLQYSP